MAVVSANGGDPEAGPSNLPASASLPGSATATPSFAPTSAPPPLDPRGFISSAKKDTAPLSPDTLFPDKQLPVDGTVYKKGPTADTTSCATAAGGTLPKILTANGCTRLMRTTYTDGGIAVTVGVAVFDTAAQATKAKAQTDDRSIVRSLFGKGVKPFCDGAFCRSTRNAYGRYAYFTISGFTSGKDVTTKDTKVFRAGNDLAQFAANQIHRRGQTQASAAANQQLSSTPPTAASACCGPPCSGPPAARRRGSRPPPGVSPCGRTTWTAESRTPAASTFPGHSGPRCPSPTNSSAPISDRTMLWQNASARTVAVMIPSSPRTRLSSCSVRMVVAPSRFLQ